MYGAPGQGRTRRFVIGERLFMLNQLRQGAKGWVSKVLMGLLVLSFAVWGIGGFQGYGAGTLATVGDQEVTVQEFARLYDQAQRVASQSGQSANTDQVLSQLLLGAAVDDEASRYGLGVSDDRVAEEIADTEVFQNANGVFDRQRFETLLLSSRMDPDEYIADVKRDLVRGQIAGSINAGIEAPQPAVEAIYRLRNEERTISYFVVDDSAIEPVGEPSEAALQAYFEEQKADFRAPEYRALALLTLQPATLADPSAVTEEEIQAEYERRKASFEQPERRRVEQISFDDADAANAALAAIEGGEDFAAVAESNGLEVTDLGLKTKAEVLDPAIAEAAFAAEIETPVAVTEGALQPSVIRVTEVEAGSVTPLSEVEERLRGEIATRNARETVNDVYDQIEDERAAGSTLEEAAKALSLPYRQIDAVARDLRAPDGSLVFDVPNVNEVINEAFESDIGIENSPIRAGDGWVFMEVTDVTPARDRTLDEVRDEVVAAWTEAETQQRIAERADSLFERLQGGTPLATLAGEIGATVQTTEGVTRTESPEGLSGNAVNQAFAGPQGHVANAEGPGNGRTLLKVDRVVTPAFFAETTDAQEIAGQLTEGLQESVREAFYTQLRNSRDINVNNAVLQQLTGQLAGQVPIQ
jgi:peptidyl-prolyl cis-trans isomerase D